MTVDGRPKTKGARRDPRFSFFLETIRQPVTPKHPAWSRPLPLSRCPSGPPPSYDPHSSESISVGDYFLALRSFLQGSGRDAIAGVLEQRRAAASAPQIFRVFLAKHGEYYHPARVETDSRENTFRWVVNVAVSAAGKTLLPKEYAILKRLNRENPISYLPEVYAASEADAGHGRSVALFLGEWLTGFHEFHLTQDAPGSGQTPVLWDPEKGRIRMDSRQSAAVYHQVARILTHYFNLATFEAIGGWHHAAGDFVVRMSGSQPEVRLITVRNYRPLFQSWQHATNEIPGLETLLQALLIFLLNLGMRTRLDRLDGTGDMAWSDSVAVEATVAGMLEALAQKSLPSQLPLPIDQLFRRYLASCDADDLQEMCGAIAAKAFAPGSPEHPLIKDRLPEHCVRLAAVLSRV